jgi:hypothetical protein
MALRVSRTTPSFNSLQDLADHTGPEVMLTSGVRRGELIEIEVELSVDPVFHMSTIASEFDALASDFPQAFGEVKAMLDSAQMGPVNKVLRRLLAGLVPIRGRAINYVVASIGAEQYLLPESAAQQFGLPTTPLIVVGVTEQNSYWKDLRRVLFANASYTLLCRVSKDGLHKSWTPVKAAEVFTAIAPSLVPDLNRASSLPFTEGAGDDSDVSVADSHHLTTLLHYCQLRLDEAGTAHVEGLSLADLNAAASEAVVNGQGASHERRSFNVIDQLLVAHGLPSISPTRAAELREEARQLAGFDHFARTTATAEAVPPSAPAAEGPAFLDVEIVAIYW